MVFQKVGKEVGFCGWVLCFGFLFCFFILHTAALRPWHKFFVSVFFFVFFILHTAAKRPWHIYKPYSPPPGRGQLMRLPYLLLPERPHKNKHKHKNKTTKLQNPRRVQDHDPGLYAPPGHSSPVIVPALRCASPSRSSSLSVSLHPRSPPPGSSSLSLPRMPTSVVAKNSRMAAVQRSSPNSWAIEVLRGVRFPSVALRILRHMLTCCSFHRLQSLKRCSRVCDGPEPEQHHQHLSFSALPIRIRYGPVGALFIRSWKNRDAISLFRCTYCLFGEAVRVSNCDAPETMNHSPPSALATTVNALRWTREICVSEEAPLAWFTHEPARRCVCVTVHHSVTAVECFTVKPAVLRSAGCLCMQRKQVRSMSSWI
jgi:hypothetical protein